MFFLFKNGKICSISSHVMLDTLDMYECSEEDMAKIKQHISRDYVASIEGDKLHFSATKTCSKSLLMSLVQEKMYLQEVGESTSDIEKKIEDCKNTNEKIDETIEVKRCIASIVEKQRKFMAEVPEVKTTTALQMKHKVDDEGVPLFEVHADEDGNQIYKPIMEEVEVPVEEVVMVERELTESWEEVEVQYL